MGRLTDEGLTMNQLAERNAEYVMKIAALEDKCAALEAAQKRIAELERSETQLIGERDNAESALNNAYKAVMGQAPEWSNWFSFGDAIDEIELACELWRNRTDDVKCRDLSLPAAPQQEKDS